MFTIKHISETGAESLYEADEVTFQPTFSDSPSEDGSYIYIRPPNSPPGIEKEALRGGTVYVMNRWGATVAKYGLSVSAAKYASVAAIQGGISGLGVGSALGRAA